MKKGKKILAVIVLAFQTLSLTAGAAKIDSFQYAAGSITVKGTSGESVVAYKVYDKESSGEAIEDLCEMGEAEVTDGKFEIIIKMPKTIRGEETDGDYVFAVMGETQDTWDFEVIARSSMETFVAEVNGIASGADLITLFEGTIGENYTNLEIIKSLGADAEYYINLGDEKEKFANVFFTENSEKTATVETFSKLFENAKCVQYINKNKADSTWLSESGLEFEGNSFGEIADEALKTWILENMNSVITQTSQYDSYSEIEKKYREANVLYVLNKAKHTEYEKKIALYDDIIDIKEKDYYQYYLNMKPAYKNTVNADVKNSVTTSPVISAEDFRARYKTSVEKVKKQIEQDAATSGPSSGGGGGGGINGKHSAGVSMIQSESSNPTKDPSGFNDLANFDWAKKAITELAKNGIVSGYDDNTFKPQKNITREEFIKMVVAAKGMSLDADACELADVDQSKWYAPYVNAAYQSGIIKGISETEFGIGKEITREDMAVIIARIMSYENADGLQNVFADEDIISIYAKDAVYSLYKAGKIAGIGDNMFGPKQIVNRAQAGKIIYDTLFSGM